LAKTLHGDIEHSEKVVLEVAEIVGTVVGLQVTVPLIMNMLGSEEIRGNNRLATNLLTILARFIVNKKEEELESFRKDLFALLSAYTGLFKDNDEGMASLLEIAEQLLNGITQVASGT
jgi:translation initiation factor 2B subunit (eIF-2B alpha/beta/delta family)